MIFSFQQQPSSIAEAMILDTEAAVMANFDFLAHTDIDMEEEDNDGEEDIYDSNTDAQQNKVRVAISFLYTLIDSAKNIDEIVCFFFSLVQTSILLGEDVDAEAEEVLNELNLLTEHEESIIHVDMDTNEWSKFAD